MATRFALISIAFLLLGCGSSAPPPPPLGDFSLTVSPTSVSAPAAATTSPVMITVNALDGFTGTVDVTLQGIPTGVTPSPSSSFSLAAGASQSITFAVSSSAAVGHFSITANGVSGKLSHNAQFTLAAQALVRTYQIGSVLYLESGTATDTSRIGLETMWGGSIVEVSVNGTNYVNRHDTGREVQPSYRDGNNLNYNPTLGGDDLDQGTPTTAYTVSADSLYTKAVPLQWSVELYGGSLGHPILGDILVEQTVTAVVDQPHTFKAHFKATHLANDLHSTTGQEFPAVYTNQDYNHFVSYMGSAPWTNGAVTATLFPDLGLPNPPVYTPELWGALVNSQNIGLAVFVPSQDPFTIGFQAPDPGAGSPTDNATNYFAPLGNLTIVPGMVFEGDIYMVAGDVSAARNIIYQLHQTVSAPDLFAPYQNTDEPAPGSTLSGVASVSGWAFDDHQVAKVEILVDGAVDGTANYGSSRPDVHQAYPASPVNVGFSYSLNTLKYSNGAHTLTIRATDTSGNLSLSPDETITISN